MQALGSATSISFQSGKSIIPLPYNRYRVHLKLEWSQLINSPYAYVSLGQRWFAPARPLTPVTREAPRARRGTRPARTAAAWQRRSRSSLPPPPPRAQLEPSPPRRRPPRRVDFAYPPPPPPVRRPLLSPPPPPLARMSPPHPRPQCPTSSPPSLRLRRRRREEPSAYWQLVGRSP
jgi:hypothetical protein